MASDHEPLVLGLDTSCYTTSAALAQNDEIIGFQRMLLPVAMGERGLRQSEAVFAHLRQLPQVLEALPDMAGKLSAVCVSVSPRDGEDSYMPVFTAGASFARAIGKAAGIPVLETTHQRGHIRAALWRSGLTGDSFLAVHLSGGTTEVMLMRSGAITTLGGSRDLHAGQLVDRIGVMLGLPFPAGPHLEALALRAGASRQLLPVSMEGGYCHLSGAEAALKRLYREGLSPETVALEVYSLLTRTVMRMLEHAREETGEDKALLAGGVASSGLFRQMLTDRVAKRRSPLKLYFGEPRLSSDNAFGVALLGADMIRSVER